MPIFLMEDFNSDMPFKVKPTSLCINGKMPPILGNSFCMKYIIKAPTRIAKETKSLIDLLISTSEEKVI